MDYIILIIVGVVGFILGKYFGKQRGVGFASKSENEMKDMRVESREALSERTENRKNRILEFIKREMLHQEQLKGCDLGVIVVGATCNEIEALLGVSEGTAHKYLNELEDEGKIEQIGGGSKVTYILK